MRTVQIYVEGRRLELFKDESISVKSTQQNISDISKVMTDFSKTFNIPASPNNNAIFQHFYETDVNSTIDHNIRREASIEIDLTEFRRGEVSIEKSSVNNGQAESYAVTFYGEVVSLKDKFADELLSDVTELSDDSFSYTASNVVNEVQDDTVSSVKFPLIVGRNVTYGDDESTDISHTGSDSINTGELFPAVNMKTLFDAIATRYDLTFNGTFLDDNRFKKAYLYCKNAETFQFVTKNKDFIPVTTTTVGTNNNTSLSASSYYDYINNRLRITADTFDNLFPNITHASNPTGTYTTKTFRHDVYLNISNVSDTSKVYFVDVFNNGALVQTVTGSDTQSTTLSLGSVFDGSNESIDVSFSFRVRANSPISLTVEAEYIQNGTALVVSPDGSTNLFSSLFPILNTFKYSQDITLSQDLDVTNYVPKMKVADFFKGVLNMFNLTCYGQGKDIYQIEPLDDWYSKGAIVDISQYTDVTSVDVNKVPLYKSIEFKYKESKSVTNQGFKDTFSRNYGDTKAQFEYDGGDYKIELPFENLMFNKFTSTDLQVGLNINKDLQSFIPEPTILYMYEYTDADFRLKFFDNNAVANLSGYAPFGQDAIINGTDVSLNFSADYSTLLNSPSGNNLFSSYYYPYLSNLYNLKNRNTKIKAILPTSLITSLELNDRIIIRGKRYTINEMSTSLTDGVVQFDLLNDFRSVLSEQTTTGGGGGTAEPLLPTLEAQCLDVRVLLPHGAVSATVTCPDVGSINPSSITEDTTVTVCIPSNNPTDTKILTEDELFNLALEDGTGDDVLQEEGGSGGSVIPYVLTVTYTFLDGSQASNLITILQQP